MCLFRDTKKSSQCLNRFPFFLSLFLRVRRPENETRRIRQIRQKRTTANKSSLTNRIRKRGVKKMRSTLPQKSHVIVFIRGIRPHVSRELRLHVLFRNPHKDRVRSSETEADVAGSRPHSDERRAVVAREGAHAALCVEAVALPHVVGHGPEDGGRGHGRPAHLLRESRGASLRRRTSKRDRSIYRRKEIKKISGLFLYTTGLFPNE